MQAKQLNHFVALCLSFIVLSGARAVEVGVSYDRALQQRIVGGKPVAREAYPAFAIPAGSRLCGATVIHTDVLLTAAHCQGAFLEGALIGATQLSGVDLQEFLPVELERPHPEYLPGPHDNDIMLVKLESFSSVPLVEYNSNSAIPESSHTLRIIGFGQTSTGAPSSSTLQQVEVEMISNDVCERILRRQGYSFNNETMLCSSTGSANATVGSCNGDSGGPVFEVNSGVQVGIVSWGAEECGDPDTPDVNVRVAEFSDWIFTTICCISDDPPDTCPSTITCETNTPSLQPSNFPSTFPSSTTSSQLRSSEPTSSDSTSANIFANGDGSSAMPSSVPSSTPSSFPTIRPIPDLDAIPNDTTSADLSLAPSNSPSTLFDTISPAAHNTSSPSISNSTALPSSTPSERLDMMAPTSRFSFSDVVATSVPSNDPTSVSNTMFSSVDRTALNDSSMPSSMPTATFETLSPTSGSTSSAKAASSSLPSSVPTLLPSGSPSERNSSSDANLPSPLPSDVPSNFTDALTSSSTVPNSSAIPSIGPSQPFNTLSPSIGNASLIVPDSSSIPSNAPTMDFGSTTPFVGNTTLAFGSLVPIPTNVPMVPSPPVTSVNSITPSMIPSASPSGLRGSSKPSFQSPSAIPTNQTLTFSSTPPTQTNATISLPPGNVQRGNHSSSTGVPSYAPSSSVSTIQSQPPSVGMSDDTVQPTPVASTKSPTRPVLDVFLQSAETSMVPSASPSLAPSISNEATQATPTPTNKPPTRPVIEVFLQNAESPSVVPSALPSLAPSVSNEPTLPFSATGSPVASPTRPAFDTLLQNAFRPNVQEPTLLPSHLPSSQPSSSVAPNMASLSPSLGPTEPPTGNRPVLEIMLQNIDKRPTGTPVPTRAPTRAPTPSGVRPVLVTLLQNVKDQNTPTDNTKLTKAPTIVIRPNDACKQDLHVCNFRGNTPGVMLRWKFFGFCIDHCQPSVLAALLTRAGYQCGICE